ncbi:hypothetical protein K1719_031432 [Acacia pycnantha]|nr:hypothetical protein K1719_031432 [Acacia pycnantha]
MLHLIRSQKFEHWPSVVFCLTPSLFFLRPLSSTSAALLSSRLKKQCWGRQAREWSWCKRRHQSCCGPRGGERLMFALDFVEGSEGDEDGGIIVVGEFSPSFAGTRSATLDPTFVAGNSLLQPFILLCTVSTFRRARFFQICFALCVPERAERTWFA